MMTWIIDNRFGGFCQQPQPRNNNINFVLWYCFILSISFVVSLYIFVPSNIRRLDRDHPLHIKWRSFASLIVSFIALLTYNPIIFGCIITTAFDDNNNSNNDSDNNESTNGFLVESIDFALILLSNNIKCTTAILIHTMTLYIGPIVANLLRVYEIRKQQQQHKSSSVITTYYIQDVFVYLIKPTYQSILFPSTNEQKWINIRNYVVAPLTEEIVFRGCMVSSFLSLTDDIMTHIRISLVAPLFFGIAHIHHAITKLAKGNNSVSSVLLVTIFQFIYTTLFGWYASYAYIKTNNSSILAIIVCHSYCNYMGLPDLSPFLNVNHPLYKYRNVLLIAYVIGIVSFKYMFRMESIFRE